MRICDFCKQKDPNATVTLSWNPTQQQRGESRKQFDICHGCAESMAAGAFGERMAQLENLSKRFIENTPKRPGPPAGETEPLERKR